MGQRLPGTQSPSPLGLPAGLHTYSRQGWGRPGWHCAVFSPAPHPLTAFQCSLGSLPPGAANLLEPSKARARQGDPGDSARVQGNGPDPVGDVKGARVERGWVKAGRMKFREGRKGQGWSGAVSVLPVRRTHP